jgi:transposase
MPKDTMPRREMTIGLDLGDKYSWLYVLDETAKEVEQSRVATTAKAMRQRFQGVACCRVVLEVGTHSPWVTRLLEELGHEVVVANPRRVRLIYQNNSKADRMDAEKLARLGRWDPKLLYPVRHRGEQRQRDLSVLRARHGLVRGRTQLINHVRGVVKAHGGRIGKCSSSKFARQAGAQMPAELRPALMPVLAMISMMSRWIRKYDRQVEQMATEKYPETVLLRQVPGVGPVTATSYVLTIEDPGRFPTSRSVGAYLGLSPKRKQSGQQDPEMPISKAGDRELRRLMIQSAQYILGPFGPDTDLRRWGLVKASQGGKAAKKRAVVAVARKLAVLLHYLWRHAVVYEPLWNFSRRPDRPAAVA